MNAEPCDLPLLALTLGALEVGRVCPEGGRLAVEWVVAAIDRALAGEVGGIVTAPLNKEAMNRAGFAYAGQGVADATNMGCAIRLGARLARARAARLAAGGSAS